MKKSKENIFKKIIKKQKKLSKKIIKNTKNKTIMKKCHHFCKNDYMPEMKKVIMKGCDKDNTPYKTPTKQEDELVYNSCKKTYCNTNCNGYNFVNKETQNKFKKEIKNGFQNTYSKDRIEMLKKRGALSGCFDIVDYDIFHK
jgi:hypothetical protein